MWNGKAFALHSKTLHPHYTLNIKHYTKLMGYVIAVAGKGGTGKTTIAALIVRILKEQKLGSILAVDADPNSNLGEALGIQPKETIGKILDELASHPQKIPAGMSKDRFIEYKVQTAVEEQEGFDVLTMGRPEGPGCYCYVNNVLRNIITKFIKDYDYIIIDNEAGLEHLSRRTTRSAEVLLIVSDATYQGLKAARRIGDLAKELEIKIKKEFLLVNCHNQDIDKERIKSLRLSHLGNVPFDSKIQKNSLIGHPLTDLKNDAVSLSALRKLGERIWQ